MATDELLPLLQQLVVAATVATAAVTLGIMPRLPRRSRAGAPVLLALVGIAAAVASWQYDAPSLIGVLMLPALAWAGTAGPGSAWKPWAAIYLTCMVQNAVVYLAYLACAVLQSPSTPELALGVAIWLIQACSLLVAFPYTFDLLNVLGRRRFRARDRMLATPDPATWPSVCFQVPTYDEPPELVEATLRELMRQDYPGRWMIQVIDNNTPDPATWKPIEALCEQLGEKVHFLHLDDWPGFKSGALNEGTRRLPDWVELLAVVDADYRVEPGFLRATARHFADPAVSLVQSPQHYREWQATSYFPGLNFMYETFWATYLPSRNEMNAVICGGTMAVIRRSHLEAAGMWDEASITEDYELSLRLAARGGVGVYDHRAQGAGLMPFTFEDLAKQRFRWAFGTAQLLKKHWRPLLGLRSADGSRLGVEQRLSFLGLIFQFLIEVVVFASALMLFFIVGAAALGQDLYLPFWQTVIIVPLLLVATNVVRNVWGLRAVTSCTVPQAVGALLFFFALSWTTVRACVAAMVRQRGVFLRTPKAREQARWQRALRVTRHEMVLAAAFIAMAVFGLMQDSGSAIAIGLLAYHGVIYAMSPLCSLASEGVWLLPRWLLGGRRRPAAVAVEATTAFPQEASA